MVAPITVSSNDVCDIWLSRENSFAIRFFFSVYTQLASQILFI